MKHGSKAGRGQSTQTCYRGGRKAALPASRPLNCVHVGNVIMRTGSGAWFALGHVRTPKTVALGEGVTELSLGDDIDPPKQPQRLEMEHLYTH